MHPDGYGKFSWNNRIYRAHRVALVFANGAELLPNTVVCHKCDNPPCVNPAHLFVSTQAGNRADTVAKNRQAKGETNGRAKLTAPQVLNIVEMVDAGTTMTGAARLYGVDRKVVSFIMSGINWGHLTGRGAA